MKRNARLMILIILALFLMPLLAYATPLESFTENPIPYWTDDSTDVNLSWNSTAQTVTFESFPFYLEDMSDVSDWDVWAPATISSDGEVASLEFDSEDDWSQAYTNFISLTVDTGYYMEIRYRANVTIDAGYVTATSEAAGSGTALCTLTIGYISDLLWHTLKGVVTTAGTIESIKLSLADNADATFIIDYLRIGAPELNVSVPIEPDTTQSIEFMGNFSALNSTVRFQMYDNATPSLFCDVNATQVTFPDSTYAEFTNFARINFTLDEERIIFKIYVFDLNMTLINSYSSYVGPANNDYLFMTDSEFEGSYTLWYLQGDIGYLAEVIDTENIFYLLFLSLEMWGYLGPVMLVIVGYVLAKQEAFLGVLWFIVECLFVAQYLELVGATPNYWWHILIILLGGLFTCIFPALLKRR